MEEQQEQQQQPQSPPPPPPVGGADNSTGEQPLSTETLQTLMTYAASTATPNPTPQKDTNDNDGGETKIPAATAGESLTQAAAALEAATASVAATAATTQPAEESAEEEQQQQLPPVIQNLRNCFKELTNEQFESEVEIERVRRLYESGNTPTKKLPAAADNDENDDSNKKRAAVDDDNNDGTDSTKKKQKSSSSTLEEDQEETSHMLSYPIPPSYHHPYQHPIYPHYPSVAPPAHLTPPEPPHYTVLPKFSPSYAHAAQAALMPKNKKKTSNKRRAAAGPGGGRQQQLRPGNVKFWNEQYEKLLVFKQEHGHVIVPYDKKKYPHLTSLHNWIRKQKDKWKLIHEGGNDDDDDAAAAAARANMSDEQIEKLIAVGLGTAENGPTNFAKTTIQTEWEERFAELKDFKNECGHTNVSDYIHKDTPYYKLAIWVQNQRKNFQNRQAMAATGKKRFKTGIMTDEQMLKLAAIGFRFAHKLQTFDERVEQVQEFVQAHGHTRVPLHFTGMGNLGAWVKKIKDQYHAGKLAPERIAKLDALEFDWSRQPRGSVAVSGTTSASASTTNANTNAAMQFAHQQQHAQQQQQQQQQFEQQRKQQPQHPW